MNEFPEFGKELQRSFEVHENCYDCAAFYDGCKGWRASRDFDCRDFHRRPDVGIDGRRGQEFPPSRRKSRTQPEPIEQRDAVGAPAIDTPPRDPPPSRPRHSGKPGARICGCGAVLPKGKRLCDTCRTQSRRRTKRRHMKGYMRKRRSGGD
jgi:hypothetical protein